MDSSEQHSLSGSIPSGVGMNHFRGSFSGMVREVLANSLCSQPSPAGPGLAQGLGICWPHGRSTAWYCEGLLRGSEQSTEGSNLSHQHSPREALGVRRKGFWARSDRQGEFIRQELGGGKKGGECNGKANIVQRFNSFGGQSSPWGSQGPPGFLTWL